MAPEHHPVVSILTYNLIGEFKYYMLIFLF